METRELMFFNRDGKRIPATLRLPVGEAKGTILVLHGLAGWREQSTVVTIAEAATKAGYISLTIDGADCLRGPDASFWASTTSGFIRDMEDVIEHMRRQEWYAGPLLLAGHSLGGLCSVRYACMHPGVASRLLLVAPGISWRKDRSGKFLKKLGFISETLTKRFKETPDLVMPLYPPWILDFLKYDTRKDAPFVEVPVAIVSAGEDLVVAGIEEHDALARRFEHATHEVIPGATHTFEGHERQLAAIVTKWLTSS